MMKTKKPGFEGPIETFDSRDEMKESVASKIKALTILDYEYKNVISDVTIVEDGNPILNIYVLNWKWDSHKMGLMSPNDHTPNLSRVDKLQNDCEIPLYICRTKRRIEETAQFANFWIEKNYNELYKLYPNKIAEINKRRKQ